MEETTVNADQKARIGKPVPDGMARVYGDYNFAWLRHRRRFTYMHDTVRYMRTTVDDWRAIGAMVRGNMREYPDATPLGAYFLLEVRL